MECAAFWAGPPAAQTESKLAKCPLGPQGEMQEDGNTSENHTSGRLRGLLGAERPSGFGLLVIKRGTDSYSVKELCESGTDRFASSACSKASRFAVQLILFSCSSWSFTRLDLTDRGRQSQALWMVSFCWVNMRLDMELCLPHLKASPSNPLHLHIFPSALPARLGSPGC